MRIVWIDDGETSTIDVDGGALVVRTGATTSSFPVTGATWRSLVAPIVASGLDALAVAELELGDDVALVGDNPITHAVSMAAKLSGLPVADSETRPQRAVARRLWVVTSRSEDVVAATSDARRGDVVLVATPDDTVSLAAYRDIHIKGLVVLGRPARLSEWLHGVQPDDVVRAERVAQRLANSHALSGAIGPFALDDA